ncbi:hypothetical protein HPB48_004848 [Haemaphysalis longicornis]|uniref:Transposase Helix-turn-helix domain-containing protein n=1 Tax=Haemaphysalis longicornis TaxID=44386 RepID=A0A9J6H622_HAELO|nr:hypothetical protein HPB48_004848 [Haemaphysalis longicornis]
MTFRVVTSVCTTSLQTTQTDGDLCKGSCKIFLSVTSNGTASTQVCHVGSQDCATQVDVIPKRTVPCGDEEQSSVFTGYRSLNEREDFFAEVCGGSANAFALLLSLLASRVVRITDVPISQKLVIFLMKMKLGLSFASIGVLFGIHRATASRIFYFILSNLLRAMEPWIPETPTRCSAGIHASLL